MIDLTQWRVCIGIWSCRTKSVKRKSTLVDQQCNMESHPCLQQMKDCHSESEVCNIHSALLSHTSLLLYTLTVCIFLLLMLSGDVESNPGPIVENKDIPFLCDKLRPLNHYWKAYGIALDVPYSTIQVIGSQTARERMTEVLWLWRDSKGKKTWGVVHNAVKRLRNLALVEIIERKGLSNEVPMGDSYIQDMMTLLQDIIPEWEAFGIGLEIPFGEMSQSEKKLSSADYMRKVIEKWIKQYGSEATIYKIIGACHRIKDFALAKTLQEDKTVRERFGMDDDLESEEEKIHDKQSSEVKTDEAIDYLKTPEEATKPLSELVGRAEVVLSHIGLEPPRLTDHSNPTSPDDHLQICEEDYLQNCEEESSDKSSINNISFDVLRSHHGELCKVLTVSSTTLSSLTLELFSKKIIELDVKTDVLEKGGVHGADVLLTHVLIKSERNPKHLNVVQEALEKQSTLDEITEKMKNSCVTEISSERFLSAVREATGVMRVAPILLHGAPCVGKSSVKRMILNQPPLKKEEEFSTPIAENPVRAISTGKMISSFGDTDYEVVDEKKLIAMIRREVKSHRPTRQSLKNEIPQTPDVSPQHKTPDLNSSDPTGVHVIQEQNSNPDPETDENMTDVLKEISEGVDMIDDSTRSLFDVEWTYLVDSGGQPQFSDLLPLVFCSESLQHIVVIGLDEKLDDKPRNRCIENGKEHVFPEALKLTNFEMIERVCQLVKATNCGKQKSHVMVVGTRLDKVCATESVEDKNRRLIELEEKYKSVLVCRSENEVLFPINAIASPGSKRKEYTALIHKGLKALHTLHSTDVPVRSMVFQLELSRRSINGIVPMSECSKITHPLGMDDSDVENACSFFKKVVVQFHYPALPDHIFTKLDEVVSTLSHIVKATYTFTGCTIKDEDREKLKKTGMLTKKYLNKLFPATDCKLSTEEFLELIVYLRIAFSMGNDTYFLPSVLPIDSVQDKDRKFATNHCDPVLLLWENNVLPQGYFPALVVQLLKKGIELCHTPQFRHALTLNYFKEGNFCGIIRLFDFAKWMVMTFNDELSRCPDVLEVVKESSREVLNQLNLSSLGDLEVRFFCRCNIVHHPCKPADNSFRTYVCPYNGLYYWKETCPRRICWLTSRSNKGTEETDNPGGCLLKKSPDIDVDDVYALLKCMSASWQDLGRALKVPYNDRESLCTDITRKNDDGRLEAILHKWKEAGELDFTWPTILKALEKCGRNDIVKKVHEFLEKPEN